MGYSKSPRAVHLVRNYLDEMLRADTIITWFDIDPVRLAYKIQNGINAARSNAIKDGKPLEPFFMYSKLKGKFIIRTKDNKVIAEPRDVIPLEIVRTGMGRLILHEPQSPLELIGAALSHKEAEELFFPSATGLPSCLNELYSWTSKNDYYIIPSDDGITLSKNDTLDLAWSPE